MNVRGQRRRENEDETTQNGTYMMFMNCSKKKHTHFYSRHIYRMDHETHHKVDPKEERIRRVEARAPSEPFGAKRHPANIEKKKEKGKTINASSNQCINHHHPIPGILLLGSAPGKQKKRRRGKGTYPP
jgi:hypothetical protein